MREMRCCLHGEKMKATGAALARPCDGVMRLGNTSRLRRLCAGRLPYQLDTWPDGLAEASDVRPVVHLDRSQEEWRISSEGTLVVATRRREVASSARLASAAGAVLPRAVLPRSGGGLAGHSSSSAP